MNDFNRIYVFIPDSLNLIDVDSNTTSIGTGMGEIEYSDNGGRVSPAVGASTDAITSPEVDLKDEIDDVQQVDSTVYFDFSRYIDMKVESSSDSE